MGRKHQRKSAADKVFATATAKPEPPTGPGVRMSAAQKDKGTPSVVPTPVKDAAGRQSAAQKGAGSVKPVQDTPAKPKPVAKKKKVSKPKPAQGFAASFEAKKLCNNCPD